MALLQSRPAPRLEGRVGAAFCVYWSHVSEDSDGPLEWCRAVPDDQARSSPASSPS